MQHIPRVSGQSPASFRVHIPDSFQGNELTIRIRFRPAADNPNVRWYRPVGPKDKHKEVVSFNVSGGIFPHVDALASFEMVYVIPNTEEVKIVSSGHLNAVREEDKNIIYSYRLVSFARDIMFAVGTYDQHDIFSNTISDLQSTIRYIEGFMCFSRWLMRARAVMPATWRCSTRATCVPCTTASFPRRTTSSRPTC